MVKVFSSSVRACFQVPNADARSVAVFIVSIHSTHNICEIEEKIKNRELGA